MTIIIDAGSELLVDRSTLTDPFIRLIVDALGQTVVDGSAWVAINKQDLGSAYAPNLSPLERPKSDRHQ